MNTMPVKKWIFFIAIIFMLFSCGSEKAAMERRSLMMPKTSEMPKNTGKFTEVNYSKRSKAIEKKKKQMNKLSKKHKKKSKRYKF